MPGKSKKGGGLQSSPVYKKQKFGIAKSPFKMKGSPYKYTYYKGFQGNKEEHLQTGVAYNPYAMPGPGPSGQAPSLRGYIGGMGNIAAIAPARRHRPVDYGGSARNIKGRKFDMDRWYT